MRINRKLMIKYNKGLNRKLMIENNKGPYNKSILFNFIYIAHSIFHATFPLPESNDL